MTDENCVRLLADRRDIAFLNRIIEGCGHVGVLSTLDKESGLVIVRSTTDMLPQLRLILQNLTFPVIFLD